MTKHRPSPLLSLLLSVLVLACDPPAPEKASSPEVAKAEPQLAKPQNQKVVEEAGDAAVEQPAQLLADYSVHEWGLVRYVGEQRLVSTSPPTRKAVEPGLLQQLNTMDDPWDPSRTDVNTLGGVRPQFKGGLGLDRPGATQEKPLILLHPGPTFELDTAISVSVELVDGTFREVWPTPALGAQPNHSSTYTWSGVHATAEPCGRELAPSPEHIACTSIAGGGLCEAAEMSLYLSPVASCLQVDDTVRTPALVYNGRAPGVMAPLAFGGGDPETIKNQTGHSFGPLYLHQGDALLRIEKLDGNGVLELSEAAPLDGDLETVLKQDLLAKGLTEGEADSFVAAWSPDVLRQPWVWQVFGFYSPEGVEAIAPMKVTPQPKEVVRVMAVTVE